MWWGDTGHGTISELHLAHAKQTKLSHHQQHQWWTVYNAIQCRISVLQSGISWSYLGIHYHMILKVLLKRGFCIEFRSELCVSLVSHYTIMIYIWNVNKLIFHQLYPPKKSVLEMVGKMIKMIMEILWSDFCEVHSMQPCWVYDIDTSILSREFKDITYCEPYVQFGRCTMYQYLYTSNNQIDYVQCCPKCKNNHCEIHIWSPTPRVLFERAAGQSLPLGARLANHDTELVISNVQEEDEGEYICYAENAAGRSEEFTIFLNIQGEFVFTGLVR